jgi:hypothetical protein
MGCVSTDNAVPDLTAIPAGKLAGLAGTVLGNAISLCQERAENGNPPAPFNSGI